MGRSPGRQSFGAFGVFRVSSPAGCSPAMQNCHAVMCQAHKLGILLRGRKDTCTPAVSALRGRAPPLPPRFRRFCPIVFSGSIWAAFTGLGLGPDLLGALAFGRFSFFVYIFYFLVKITTLSFSLHVKLSYRIDLNHLYGI